MRYLKPLTIVSCVVALTLLAVSVWGGDENSQDLTGGWRPYPGMTEATIAYRSETKLVSSVGLSWPDGRQQLVNYYAVDLPGPERHPSLHWRCHQNFDSVMRATGGMCYYLENPEVSRGQQ